MNQFQQLILSEKRKEEKKLWFFSDITATVDSFVVGTNLGKTLILWGNGDKNLVESFEPVDYSY